jgi:hypothetical protein
VAALTHADDDNEHEQVRRTIHETPLSVETRQDWMPANGARDAAPTEYKILLATGGPAVRLTGDLNKYAEPESVRLEVQDWFTEWTEVRTDQEESDALLTFARQFWYGEA